MSRTLEIILIIITSIVALILSVFILKVLLKLFVALVLFIKGNIDTYRIIRHLRKDILGDNYTKEQKEILDNIIKSYRDKNLPLIDRLVKGRYIDEMYKRGYK